MRYKVPLHAKNAARIGLLERKINNAGLTKKQADALGIVSGVERAKQLMRSKTISEDDAKSIARFYLRFKGCYTKRCETALNLWGGRKFGKLLVKKIYK